MDGKKGGCEANRAVKRSEQARQTTHTRGWWFYRHRHIAVDDTPVLSHLFLTSLCGYLC